MGNTTNPAAETTRVEEVSSTPDSYDSFRHLAQAPIRAPMEEVDAEPAKDRDR
jgi:hypothetical protein